MKKLFLFCIAISFSVIAFSQNNQIPDGGFETKWNNTNGYWDWNTDLMITLNELYTLNEPPVTEIPLTAFRSTDRVSGNYSIRVVSDIIYIGDDRIFLPGAVGTINPDFVFEFLALDDYEGTEGGGITVNVEFPYTPKYLKGFYKYVPVGKDSASLELGLYDRNRNLIHLEKNIVTEPVTGWTEFTVAMPEDYWDVEVKYIRILFTASAGYDFDEITQCDGNKGSALFLDDIYLKYEPLGLVEYLSPKLKVTTYPNPAVSMVIFKFDTEFSGKLIIYDALGSQISEKQIDGTETQFETGALSTGNYFYRFINGNEIFASGKFMVVK